MSRYMIGKSRSYNDRLKEILPGGYHYNFRTDERKIPLHFVRGLGSRIWDMDGNEYLDLYCKSGAMILGHSNNEYCIALKKQIDKLLTVDMCDIDYEVCSLIRKYYPSAEMIRFGLSGTEMVQNALRIARAYTGKNRYLKFEGHYHGNADNILGGAVSDYNNPIPRDNGQDAYSSTEGRAIGSLEEQAYMIPWNDIEILKKTVCQYGDNIAAVIMEPISINGGSILPKDGYLNEVREVCDRNNIVLIFDEVITGGRVGLRGAQGIYGIKPDITVLGKCLSGGGVPVSALLGKRCIMELYDNNRVIHAGTFNGYPLGLAAVKATIEILEKDEGACYQRLNKYAQIIHKSLIDEAEKVGIDMIVQGPASCASYHCRKTVLESSRDIDKALHAKNTILRQILGQYGIIIAPQSRMYANITLNEDDVKFFNERIPYALRDAKILIDRIAKRKYA